MEASFELHDSTDWLSTSLPAFEPLEASLRCEVCKEFYANPVITSCSHTFCSICIRRCIATDGKCPACKSACQADKLIPNITVREIAAKFQDARPKALELARTQPKDSGETPTSRRKRKREGSDADERRRNTRSRQTRSSTRRDDKTSMTDDVPVVIPDSEDEQDEYVPDGMVKCPICSKPMKEEVVFNHIPVCPAAQEDDRARNTRSRNNYAFPNALQSRPKDSAPPPTRLSGLQYSMLNEKNMRKKLQELGIPTWGTKPLMIKRHQEWLNLYNANCDASETVRKSKRDLLKELDEWERTQGGSAGTKESHIMRKDFDGQTHATTHKSQFDDLIANARKRAKEAAKAKEKQGEEASNVGTNASQPQPESKNTTEPLRPYEHNEAALSTIREKVEEANRSDSAFPALDQETKNANARAAPTLQSEESLGFDAPDHNPFESPTRKVPMFKMPEEPVLDVESSTAIQ
ncbi:E3 ubiquitin-protein ligase rad18 [Kalmusia sp. IMI 367209]|nr:E3 ubiquitin-protein ligase rad18 [Kalmusia sp. IMI 367209]